MVGSGLGRRLWIMRFINVRAFPFMDTVLNCI